VLIEKSHLEGDINAFQLVTEEGASFDGRCKMLPKPAYQEKLEIPEPIVTSEPPPVETETIPREAPSRERTGSGFVFGQFFRQFFS
jgi:cytoskeletal protein CcmA (bactofilin family)